MKARVAEPTRAVGGVAALHAAPAERVTELARAIRVDAAGNAAAAIGGAQRADR